MVSLQTHSYLDGMASIFENLSFTFKSMKAAHDFLIHGPRLHLQTSLRSITIVLPFWGWDKRHPDEHSKTTDYWKAFASLEGLKEVRIWLEGHQAERPTTEDDMADDIGEDVSRKVKIYLPDYEPRQCDRCARSAGYDVTGKKLKVVKYERLRYFPAVSSDLVSDDTVQSVLHPLGKSSICHFCFLSSFYT
jgi:hypothetical protein